MLGALAHRGPDASGTWLDESAGVALGHRRLSILELSAAGHQPMTSTSGRYVMVFNGEIYNHDEIRGTLKGVAWKGRSDTETLLAAMEDLGVEEAIERSVGMFALALWDRQERELLLARDRLGEKPLYFGWQGSSFMFASELGALKRHPSFRYETNPSAVASYLRYGYVPAPDSIYAGIGKLLPGHIWRYAAGSGDRDGRLTEYWSLAAASASPLFEGDDVEAVDELEELLTRSIALQRVADVPLGAFLSGGIDSSTVVALMQRGSTSQVRTFTVGFSESEYDESHAARSIARHLGTDHTEIVVTPAEGLDVVPLIPAMFDEPFGDESAIPTWLLAALARTRVKVSLSGDGGDELFAGYERYRTTAYAWTKARSAGPLGRATIRAALSAFPARAVQRVLARGNVGRSPLHLADRVNNIKAAFGEGPVTDVYLGRMSLWPDPSSLMRSPAPEGPVWAHGSQIAHRGPVEQMMGLDALSYMPDDVLVKVDRAAMSHGLETRLPLLDHRLVEFAWRLPGHMRLRDGTSKWVLRQLLYRYVPRELVDRPKRGFSVPLGSWLRGPLREWAEELLTDGSLDAGPLRSAPIRKLWAEHQSGAGHWQRRLWTVLVLQGWLHHDRELRSGATAPHAATPTAGDAQVLGQ